VGKDKEKREGMDKQIRSLKAPYLLENSVE